MRFKSSHSTYSIAHANLSKKVLVFYRKAMKDLTNTLAVARSEIWEEGIVAMKLLG